MTHQRIMERADQEPSGSAEPEEPIAAPASEPTSIGPSTEEAARDSKTKTYTRLPVGFWVAALALCLSLILMLRTMERHARGEITQQAAKLQAEHRTALVAARASQNATAMIWHSPNNQTTKTPGGLYGVFYRGVDFEIPYRVELLKSPFSFRTDHEWSHMPQENVSARFSSWVRIPRAGKYSFLVDANDGARVWIGEHKIFDDWDSAAIHEFAGEYELPAGDVRLYAEWYNKEGNGWFGLWWEGPGVPRQFIPANALIPAPGESPPK